jgi:tRNA threonylcarbamoyladenosine biosynthesis protein TsaE
MGKTIRFFTRNADETREFFWKFAATLKAGDIVGFTGDLGTGKTTAVKAILSFFGIEHGDSPTFVMLKPYAILHGAVGSVVHVDAYRLQSRQDILTTGLTDYLDEDDSVVLIEWADRLGTLLPSKTIRVNLTHAGGDRRTIEVKQP